VMTSRRSLGVVLIVALLAWSVNQRVIACTGVQSRAAVVVPAGTPPAPKPEPSPSRHNCCPLESKHSGAAQPSLPPDCQLHAKLDVSCCSIANNPGLRLPFQKVSRSDFGKSIGVARSQELQAATVESESPSFSALAPAWILSNSKAVLRL